MGGDPAGRRPAAGAGALIPPAPAPGAGATPPVAPRVVRVLPDVPAVHRAFDYRVPERWRHQVGVGTRVRVRLHGRAVGGWVVDADVEPPEGVELLALVAVSGLGPPPAVLALAEWAAWRWAGPVSSFLGTASPKRNVRGLPAPPHPARARSLADPTGRGPLVPAGVLAEALARVGRPTLLVVPPAEDLLALVGAVLEHRGPGMLVLVPSTGWAERLGERLRRRGVDVARDWSEAAAGWPVVLGARSAAWAPMPALAAAVVLDAHDEAYRAERTPTYNAGEVVAERAARQAAPRALVLAVPRPWSSPSGASGGRCPAALERAGWPALSVVDRRASDPRTGLLSESLVRLARGVLGVADPWSACSTAPGGPACWPAPPAGSWPAASAAAGRCPRWTSAWCAGACEPGGRWCAPPAGRPGSRCSGRGWPALREELEALLGVAGGRGVRPGPVRARCPCPTPPVLVGTEAVLHRVRRAAAVAFLDFDQQLLAPRFARRRGGAGPPGPGRPAGRGPGQRRGDRAPGPGPDPPARPRGAGGRRPRRSGPPGPRRAGPAPPARPAPGQRAGPRVGARCPGCYAAAGSRRRGGGRPGRRPVAGAGERTPGPLRRPRPRCPARRPGSGSTVDPIGV